MAVAVAVETETVGLLEDASAGFTTATEPLPLTTLVVDASAGLTAAELVEASAGLTTAEELDADEVEASAGLTTAAAELVGFPPSELVIVVEAASAGFTCALEVGAGLAMSLLLFETTLLPLLLLARILDVEGWVASDGQLLITVVLVTMTVDTAITLPPSSAINTNAGIIIFLVYLTGT